MAAVLSCWGCGSTIASGHFNARYCARCAAKPVNTRRPRCLSPAQQVQILGLVSVKSRPAIAAELGLSTATVNRLVRSTGARFRRCSQPSPEQVRQVVEAYERAGRVTTQQLFPEVRVRSIVERYPHAPRQLRWSEDQIMEAARMAGLVSLNAQARFFGRPNAYAGSIKKLWRRLGCAPGLINGLPAHLAWAIAKPGAPAVLVRHAETSGPAPKVLWLDVVGSLRAERWRPVVEALAGFQRWLHGTDDASEIRNMIAGREMSEHKVVAFGEGKPPAESESIFDARSVIQTLDGLMRKVTDEDCTASTVNAACNCAARITDLLRVHLEVERLRAKKR